MINCCNWPGRTCGYNVDRVCEVYEDSDNLIDFYLMENCAWGELSALWEQGCFIGGGLTKEFWFDRQPVPVMDYVKCLYGTIPEDAEPEIVLAQLKKIRERA